MFPNLRLIGGAAIATIALILVMGSGMLSLRDPSRTVADVPELRWPLVQQSMIDAPERQLQRLASARRNDELQRLLDLPTTAIRAYAPETPAAYSFRVAPVEEPPADGAADARTTAEETARSDAGMADAGMPDTGAPARVPRAAALSAPPAQADQVRPAEAAADVAPAPALAPLAAPADPEPTIGDADPAPSSPPPTDSASRPPEGEETGSIIASPVAAIARAPLPQADPREVRSGPPHSARPPTADRAGHAKARRAARIVRRPAARSPVTPFGARTDQPPLSDRELFGQHPYNIR